MFESGTSLTFSMAALQAPTRTTQLWNTMHLRCNITDGLSVAPHNVSRKCRLNVKHDICTNFRLKVTCAGDLVNSY